MGCWVDFNGLSVDLFSYLPFCVPYVSNSCDRFQILKSPYDVVINDFGDPA